MVVFFKVREFDEHGQMSDPIVRPSKLAIAYSYAKSRDDDVNPIHLGNRDDDKEAFGLYKVAGVTYIDTMPINGSKTDSFGTVYVNGAVPFCNTGPDPIDAGDEVWVLIGSNENDLPKTIGRRDLTVKELTDAYYKYVGLCIMGCEASDISVNVVRHGQILLGVE